MKLLAMLQKVFGQQQGKEIYDRIAANKNINVLIEEANKPKYVDKIKFDQAVEQIENYKMTIAERDKQIVSLQKLARDPKKLETMEEEIEELKIKNKKAEEEYDKQLKQSEFEYHIEKALDPQVNNVKAVKALLDMEKITIDKDKVVGLKEQLDKLKKSDAYLFKSTGTLRSEESDTVFGGTGQIGNPGVETYSKSLSFGARLAQRRLELQKVSEAQQKFFS